MKDFELPLTELKGVTVNGDLSMTGKKAGLMVELGEKWRPNSELFMNHHCISYQQSTL
jgi:hypothetical protein